PAEVGTSDAGDAGAPGTGVDDASPAGTTGGATATAGVAVVGEPVGGVVVAGVVVAGVVVAGVAVAGVDVVGVAVAGVVVVGVAAPARAAGRLLTTRPGVGWVGTEAASPGVAGALRCSRGASPAEGMVGCTPGPASDDSSTRSAAAFPAGAFLVADLADSGSSG
ncbi:MAG: hypothetical protein WA797_05190, partial [Acidimicrobiales bacterium]